MRSYQLVLLLKSDIKKEQKEKLLEDVAKWIGKTEKSKTESLGEKKLAYPIKHDKKSEYILITFEADKVGDGLDNKLRVHELLLRHLLIRTK